MKVEINNKPVHLDDGATLADALEAASIPSQGIATAVNSKVISANLRANTILNDGDKILIIKAFCGG
ncbi:MAG: sulfur carrier protein ThiS [Muribaculaceae bacterium]|nr:sulfur carrier protein ThiS [Muribaculaceae bacterium]MDE6320784.1 sulfur carrier protein ThiS [Muribaculaceae bacterium]